MPFVAFDLQGTLCTYDKVVERIWETFSQRKDLNMTPEAAKDFFEYWYSCSMRDYIATSQAGKYCPLLKVLKSTLTCTLLCFRDVTPTDLEIQTIMMSFDTIEADMYAIEALDILLKEGWDIWVLSLGGFDDTVALLNRTRMSRFTKDNLLCCDQLRISKPHPRVYSELMRMAVHRTQRIENFYMVGSHAFDLAGAKNVSLRTVFLNTKEKIYSAQMYDAGGPDIIGHHLIDCVTKLVEFERTRKYFIQPLLHNNAAFIDIGDIV